MADIVPYGEGGAEVAVGTARHQEGIEEAAVDVVLADDAGPGPLLIEAEGVIPFGEEFTEIVVAWIDPQALPVGAEGDLGVVLVRRERRALQQVEVRFVVGGKDALTSCNPGEI